MAGAASSPPPQLRLVLKEPAPGDEYAFVHMSDAEPTEVNIKLEHQPDVAFGYATNPNAAARKLRDLWYGVRLEVDGVPKKFNDRHGVHVAMKILDEDDLTSPSGCTWIRREGDKGDVARSCWTGTDTFFFKAVKFNMVGNYSILFMVTGPGLKKLYGDDVEYPRLRCTVRVTDPGGCQHAGV